MTDLKPTEHEEAAFLEMRRLRALTSVEANSAKRIYIDTNFWSWFSDIERGNFNGPTTCIELYNALREGVASEHIICPISDLMLYELFQKSDASDVSQTLSIMDALSRKTAFLEADQRGELEFATWAAWLFESATDFQPTDMLFTKPFFALGERVPRGQNPDFYKFFISRVAEFSFSEVFGRTPHQNFKTLREPRLWEELNKQAWENTPQEMRLEIILDAEIRGIVEANFEVARKYLIERLERDGEKAPPGFQDSKECWNLCLNTLMASITKKHSASNALGSLLLSAHLHAQIRATRKQPLTPNDFFDIQHASIAMIHCDAFLTDRGNMSRCQVAARQLGINLSCEPASARNAVKTISALTG